MSIPNFSLAERQDISELESVLLKDGKLQCVDYAQIAPFPQSHITQFCVLNACYQIVTWELVEFLKVKIGSRKAIEIGAGNGCLGRAMGIPMTDNYIQNRPHVKKYYESIHQPIVQYGEDVVNLEARNAIAIYRPQVVVGAWVSQVWKWGQVDGLEGGVDEMEFKGRIQQYIMAGNESTHQHKVILKDFPFKAYKFPWLISRSINDKDKNVIWIFDCA
ncbi:MAG: hypothetical protein WKF87_21135 [Chryseolinea sp.]